MAVSKTLRFEVFKRDGFKCVYCGKNPPEVVLECDHFEPKVAGGSDDINNLVTACFDCNRGKRHIPIDKIPQSVSDNLEVLKEKELQLHEYKKFAQKVERRVQVEIEQVAQVYSDAFKGWQLTENFKSTSIRTFLRRLPVHEVVEAMRLACDGRFDGRFDADRDRSIRYFCGVCWKKIKGQN